MTDTEVRDLQQVHELTREVRRLEEVIWNYDVDTVRTEQFLEMKKALRELMNEFDPWHPLVLLHRGLVGDRLLERRG